MHAVSGSVSRPRALRLALAAIGPALAIVLLSIGFGLLFNSRAAEDFARMGLASWLRLLLGVSHVAGGAALLAPSLSEPASILLGLVVTWMAAYPILLGQGGLAIAPGVTALVLISYGVSSRLRRRAALASWHQLLLRYGEETDAHDSDEFRP